MTTTDRHNKLAQPACAGQNERGGDVVAFDTIKRRNRLDRLLFTRSHLASMAAQQRSHDMDEAHESFLTLCAVESTIREEFPREYESSYARWLATEVADEHPVGVLTPGCGICASIAAYCGVNLLPPESA